MEERERLRRLLAHDAWANGALLDALAACGPPPPRAVRFFAHVVGAERLWHARLTRTDQTCPVWPDWTLAESRREFAALPDLWRSYVGSLAPAQFSESVAYTNTKGEPWSNDVRDILEHVIQHSAYHRGQIASELRAAGFAPPLTDYIHYVRQGFER